MSWSASLRRGGGCLGPLVRGPPAHVNSNNQVIPQGVEIRPFGPPGSVNGWYYENVDYVLRFINPAAS